MYFFGTWLFPVFSACAWTTTILSVLVRWHLDGNPHLASMDTEQSLAYISDTGAFAFKPVFIAGCAVTAVSLICTFLAAPWLRHTGRLAPNTSSTQKALGGIAIAFAVAGSVGLILLSIFDTYRHPRLHNGFLVLFLSGYLFSGAFLCAEYKLLGAHYREHRILRVSFWVKASFILVEMVLVVVFGVTLMTEHNDIAAGFEYAIAVIFNGYILSFLLDLLPNMETRQKVGQSSEKQPDLEFGEN